MPIFPLVEPVNVSKNGSGVKGKIGDNLEENSRFTLSNIILQLSNMSLRGGEIIQSLLDETSNLNEKYTAIRTRVEALKLKVDELDPESDQTTTRSDWRSDKALTYHNIFTKETLSKALREQYDKCEPPPPFKKLFGGMLAESQDIYSNQQTNIMYTNPNYFQEIWSEQKTQERVKKRTKKTKLANPRETDVKETLENNDFYPVQLRKEKPRLSISQGSDPRSVPLSPHIYAYPSEILSFRTERTHQSIHDSTQYAGVPRVYSTRQGSFDDGASSIVYEVFDSEIRERESVGSDKDSIVMAGKFTWQCTDNNIMDRSFAETGILSNNGSSMGGTVSTQTSDKEGVYENMKNKPGSQQMQKRESVVKMMLKDFLLERRRFITMESSDYTEVSSSESDESDSSLTTGST